MSYVIGVVLIGAGIWCIVTGFVIISQAKQIKFYKEEIERLDEWIKKLVKGT